MRGVCTKCTGSCHNSGSSTETVTSSTINPPAVAISAPLTEGLPLYKIASDRRALDETIYIDSDDSEAAEDVSAEQFEAIHGDISDSDSDPPSVCEHFIG